MSGCDVQKNVDKVIDAHGGAARWRKLEAIGGRHLGPELFVQSQKVGISLDLKFRRKEGSCPFLWGQNR